MDEVIVIGDLYEDNGYGSEAGRVYSGGVLLLPLVLLTSAKSNTFLRR